MEQGKVGDRLKVARSAAGMTQEQAAERVGVARTTLVAIENGTRQSRPEELVALAKLYGVGVHSLLRESAVRVDLVGQFRRKHAVRDEDRDAVQALSLLHDLAAAYVELEKRLHKVTPVDYPAERRVGRGRVDQQAAELAAESRSRLGLGLGPIPDLASVLELELGLRIFVRPMPSSVAGVYAYHDELGACILLNRLHRRVRRRWSLAHELAHFLTTRREPSVSSSGGAKHPDDVFADAFAAAFLMPDVTTRRMYDEYVGQDGKFSSRHLILGAHRFGVSVEAFARQLERLELLPQGTYDSLRDRGLDEAAVQQVLGRQQDEGERTEPGARLLMLAAEAYASDLFSEGQLADMLVMDRIELRRAIDAFTSVDDVDQALGERPR